VAALGTLSPSAEGAFPGGNGLIAFTSDRDGDDEIYTMGADGTGVTPVTDDPSTDADPAWSPDGLRIAFRSSRNGQAAIFTMNPDGSGLANLTGANFTSESQPGWSPDAERIVFVNLTEARIYVMNADGSGQTNISGPNNDLSPAWSPNGMKIAFRSGRFPSQTSDIYTMNPDGTDVTNLDLNSSFDDSPAWSPDGQKIAFVSQRDSNFEIYVMNADGSGQTRLTNNFVSDRQPAWSPDGTQIAFTSDEDGDNEIFLMNADGSDRHPITANTANDQLPDWQPLPVLGYARPKGATPDYFSLVVAYEPCASPNLQHGAPLDVDSCGPPAQTSHFLTVGTLDANGQTAKAVGSVYMSVKLGNPSTPADEADVRLQVSVKDVRLASDLSDYAGGLQVSSMRRITDKDNTPNPGGPGPGTTQDAPFSFTVPCAPTPLDNTIGSQCSIVTTADTVLPGQVKEEQRSIWQLDQVQVYDGGADADAETPGDNTLFMTQGVFAP
jgi:Tol biopolymer transport system component